jgi:hypothetical protein
VNRGLPTSRDIAALVAFRRGFDKPQRRFSRLTRRPRGPGGDLVDVAFEYSPDVLAFFEIVSGERWDDQIYVPELESAHLKDRDFIARADLAQVRSMLTACVRGERFLDGWWNSILRDGTVVALLDRLASIKDQMDSDGVAQTDRS